MPDLYRFCFAPQRRLSQIGRCCLGLLLLLLAPLAAAEDDCRSGHDLAIVAHMDDDLLFMNPDLQQIIAAGRCLTVLYVTASERNEGVPYMLARERAVRAAYAYMANQPDDWRHDTLRINEHTFARQRLPHRPGLTLLFMRLEDPWLGKGWGSLTPLSRAESEPSQTAAAIGEFASRYTRADLVRTLAAVIQHTEPDTIRHLDDTNPVAYTELCWRCVGHGHPDHIASAKLVREAIAQAPGRYATVGYVDYPIQDRRPNLPADQADAKTAAFLRYAWLDWHYCQSAQTCRQPYGPTAAWVARSYYLSRQNNAPALLPDQHDQLLLATTEEWSNTAANWRAASPPLPPAAGRRSTQAPQAFRWPDGAAGLLLHDAVGGVWSTRLDPSSDGWSAWQPILGANIQTLAPLPGQQAAALGLGPDQQLYWSEAAPPNGDGAWRDWQRLPALANASADATWFLDDAQQWHVFLLAGDGELYTTQRASSAATWQPWVRVPAPPSTGGLAATQHSGRQTLYFRSRDGALQRMHRDMTQARWSAPEDLGLHYIGQPVIATDPRGQTTLSALEYQGGPLWVRDDNTAALRLIPHAASTPALAWANGSLHLAVRQPGALQRYARWHRDPISRQWLADSPVVFEAAPATPAMAAADPTRLP